VAGTAIVIDVTPWWKPQYFIPLVGMILGNALSGISLGMDRCLTLFDEGRAQVDAHLAHGATWWEAARPIVTESIRTGMIPIINVMSAVGLVTIPGMMTGQILSGTPPEQAAKYQIVIIFLIAAATAIGCTGTVLLATRRLFDTQHRLALDGIESRMDPGSNN